MSAKISNWSLSLLRRLLKGGDKKRRCYWFAGGRATSHDGVHRYAAENCDAAATDDSGVVGFWTKSPCGGSKAESSV